MRSSLSFVMSKFMTQSEGKTVITVTVRVSFFTPVFFSTWCLLKNYLDGFQLINPTATFWINYKCSGSITFNPSSRNPEEAIDTLLSKQEVNCPHLATSCSWLDEAAGPCFQRNGTLWSESSVLLMSLAQNAASCFADFLEKRDTFGRSQNVWFYIYCSADKVPFVDCLMNTGTFNQPQRLLVEIMSPYYTCKSWTWSDYGEKLCFVHVLVK